MHDMLQDSSLDLINAVNDLQKEVIHSAIPPPLGHDPDLCLSIWFAFSFSVNSAILGRPADVSGGRRGAAVVTRPTAFPL